MFVTFMFYRNDQVRQARTYGIGYHNHNFTCEECLM